MGRALNVPAVYQEDLDSGLSATDIYRKHARRDSTPDEDVILTRTMIYADVKERARRSRENERLFNEAEKQRRMIRPARPGLI